MKKVLIILFCLIISASIFAQEKLYIHKSDKITLGAWLSATDSVYFDEVGSLAYFKINGYVQQYLTVEIDSITFGADSDTISIVYSGNSVSVVNPLAFEGVEVTADGSNVIVNATTETKDICYLLSGTTTNGMFKLYSEKRFNLVLDGVNITNPYGPAINIQSNNKGSVTLVDGTISSLTDGSSYNAPTLNTDGEEEDQKATFFSEGKLEFTGNGTLTISCNGSDSHALASDEVIEIESGNINITTAVRDAVHAKDGFVLKGGSVNVASSNGDGIDGGDSGVEISGGSYTFNSSIDDLCGITCDSNIVITGGTINITIGGAQSKGIKSGMNMDLDGGSFTINTSGAAVTTASGSGYDVSYCTAIKCDSILTIDGANIVIKASGIAGRGISSDYDINILSGTVNITTSGAGVKYTNTSGTKDAYVSSCIKADRNVIITGGTTTTTSSGSGGKGISIEGTLTIGDSNNSPTVGITTSGAEITISSSGSGMNATTVSASAKAISVERAATINNGNISIASADDGIKSETSVIINGGIVSITKSYEGIESGLITFNNGTVSVVSSNDCINATKGTTSGGTEQNDGSYLYVNGGTVMVNMTGSGDGFDSNGNITMTGGTVIIQGPSASPEVALDYNGTLTISGGLLIAAGPNSGNNMIQPKANSSFNQCVALIESSSIGTNLFHIQDETGIDMVTFKPTRSAYYIVFSSSTMKSNTTYYVYTGGSYSGGTTINGYSSGGTYLAGTQKKSFTASTKVTAITF